MYSGISFLKYDNFVDVKLYWIVKAASYFVVYIQYWKKT